MTNTGISPISAGRCIRAELCGTNALKKEENNHVSLKYKAWVAVDTQVLESARSKRPNRRRSQPGTHGDVIPQRGLVGREQDLQGPPGLLPRIVAEAHESIQRRLHGNAVNHSMSMLKLLCFGTVHLVVDQMPYSLQSWSRIIAVN